MGDRPIRKLLAALFAALLILPAFGIGSASAACTNGYVRLYEDTNRNGDSIQLCASGQGVLTRLDQTAHSQAGLCNAPVKAFDDWNNCVSSIYVSLAAGRCVVFWDSTSGTGYQGFRTASQNGAINAYTPNDSLGSLEWGLQTGSNCAVN